jgi:hypothetical protein
MNQQHAFHQERIAAVKTNLINKLAILKSKLAAQHSNMQYIWGEYPTQMGPYAKQPCETIRISSLADKEANRIRPAE